MGRNQDRAFMQQLNKDKDWYRKLSTDKKRFIGWYIEQKVIENDNITAKILDKCFQSAISDNTDLELLDLKKIIAEANKYMQEYQEFLIKEKEGFNMIENKEVIEKVKEKIKSYISGKMDKAKGLKLLKSEFNLPNAELSDLWLQTKTELGVNTKNKHTPAKKMAELDIKLEESKEKFCKEVATDIEQVKKEEIKKISDKVDNKELFIKNEDAIELKVPSTLKIIKKTIEVQGEYGTYTKTTEGVKTENIFVKDIEDLKKYKKAVEGEYSKGKEELLQQIEDIKEEIRNLDARANNNFGIIEEIKEVFSM